MFVIGRKPFKSASPQSNGLMSSLFLMRFNFIFALPYSIGVSLIGLAIIIPPILLIFVFLLQNYDFLLRRQCFLDKYLHDMM
ncbi:MAG: hypothetical protein EGR98_11280 [Prevotella sp.]|nr:hypothetical protein [Prevotella sp.]